MAGKDDSDPKLPASARKTDVAAFLRKVAALPAVKAGGARGRLIFALDATASREPTWERACQLQSEMFDAAAALGGLAVQLVYYRGLAECKATRWLESSEKLRHAMSTVSCQGGETQIARVLDHAIAAARAGKVNALIFVGDAMEENPDALCGRAGELALLGVPLFVFHEGDDPAASRTFQELARLAGGAYCTFDARSADELKRLLGAVAAFAAGGPRALADYGRRAGGAALLLAQRLGGAS
jgi:hypothetical protein